MTNDTTQDRTRTEEFKLEGGKVLDKIKDLIHQGNIRRIILKNEAGKTLIEIPLTLGLVGAALLPVFAAVGALAAVATRMVIVVEKTETDALSPSLRRSVAPTRDPGRLRVRPASMDHGPCSNPG
ncbi:MAG: DUF4342 domain-containing protein [Holophagaceae bacterium]|uniref:DUF4342 domain-containing protein n=1 Tax=Candidatus Geothrix odensensis TaxID=2954440 RepID=A0A936F3D8_9BACT|nr:DUF4342 domain-containing protein [Candidatus Geothrix odensensis]